MHLNIDVDTDIVEDLALNLLHILQYGWYHNHNGTKQYQ